MQLSDIVPKESRFKLSAFGDEEFIVRKFTAADEIWLANEFGAGVQQIFGQMKLKEICQIAYHQLHEEQKLLFKKIKVKIVNDEGEEKETDLGGYKLMATKISGVNERIEIVRALLEAIGVSRPMQQQLEEEEKKRLLDTMSQIGQP